MVNIHYKSLRLIGAAFCLFAIPLISPAKEKVSPELAPEKVGQLCQDFERLAQENLIEMPKGCWKFSVFDSGRLSNVSDFYSKQLRTEQKLLERCSEFDVRLKALEQKRSEIKVNCADIKKKNKNKSQMADQARACALNVRKITGDLHNAGPDARLRSTENYYRLRKDWEKLIDDFLYNDQIATTSMFAEEKTECGEAARKFNKLQKQGSEILLSIYSIFQFHHYSGLRQKEGYEELHGLRHTAAGIVADHPEDRPPSAEDAK